MITHLARAAAVAMLLLTTGTMAFAVAVLVAFEVYSVAVVLGTICVLAVEGIVELTSKP